MGAGSGDRITFVLGVAAVLALAGCSDDVSWSGASLFVDTDGAHTVSFGLGRCYSDNPTEIDVRETDDEIRIDVSGRSVDSDCAFAAEVRLDEPLGDRTVVLVDADTEFHRCEDGPPTGANAPPVAQTLCTGAETVASTWQTPTTESPVPATNGRVLTSDEGRGIGSCGPNLAVAFDVPGGRIVVIVPITREVDAQPGDIWVHDVVDAVLWRWDIDTAALADDPICSDPDPEVDSGNVRLEMTGTARSGELVVDEIVIHEIAGHAVDGPIVLMGETIVRP